jgi:hypothetical protein
MTRLSSHLLPPSGSPKLLSVLYIHLLANLALDLPKVFSGAATSPRSRTGNMCTIHNADYIKISTLTAFVVAPPYPGQPFPSCSGRFSFKLALYINVDNGT